MNAKRKVLVVDDSLLARRLVRSALGDARFEFLEAADGVDGLATVRQYGDAAVLVCDIHMPRLSGMELLVQLHEDGLRIPTVVVSAECDLRVIRQTAAYGVREWFLKPFDRDALAACIERIVRGGPRRLDGAPRVIWPR